MVRPLYECYEKVHVVVVVATTTTTTTMHRVSETAQSFCAPKYGDGIENFSHDPLLCPLFMLHFKGLSVIINSPAAAAAAKQNEYVLQAGMLVVAAQA